MTSCKSARCVFDALDVTHVVRRVPVVDGRRQQVGFWIRTWDMVGKRLGVRWLISRRAPADGDLSSAGQSRMGSPFLVQPLREASSDEAVLSYVHDMHVVLISHYYQQCMYSHPTWPRVTVCF
jgi:hypothetical protein